MTGPDDDYDVEDDVEDDVVERAGEPARDLTVRAQEQALGFTGGGEGS